MKKILITMLLLSVFMVVSCGGGTKDDVGDTGNTGDTGDTGNTGDMFNPEDCTDKYPHYHAGLCWSDKASNAMNLNNANSYCEGLGGRLPKIQKLRTLIQNCPQTEYPQPDGQDPWCEAKEDPDKLADGDWTDACVTGCSGDLNVFGDTGSFWSSTPTIEEEPVALCVNFTTGAVEIIDFTALGYVRCVMKK